LSTATDIVRGEIAQILRIAPERIEPGVSLLDIGMDSLMAVELATSIEGRLGVQLSALALSDAPTIERIGARIAQQLRPNGDEAPVETGGDALVHQVRAIAAQHANEMTHEEAAAFSTEIRSTAVPILTAGQGS
jgi:acyl carrier protein